MKLVDTHQHLWDLNQFRLPWLKDVPALDRSYLISDYIAASREANVVKSVYLEVDVDESQLVEEARTILKLAENPAHPLSGVVAGGRPEKKEFRAYLDQITGHKKLRGIRRVLHTLPNEVSQSPIFAENIRALKPYGLSYDLCVRADQLPVGLQLVKKCPEVQFILDHCGVPDVKGRALDPWREHIREMAAIPNVVCKVSGVVAYADPKNWKVDDLRPFVEHVIQFFGWDRVMWGSDWPVCTLAATYQQWLNAAKEIVKNESEENREKLFAKNAERVYRV